MTTTVLTVAIQEKTVATLEQLELEQWRLTFEYPAEDDALRFTGTKLFLSLNEAKRFLDHYFGNTVWSLLIKE